MRINAMKIKYDAAKKAKTGDTIICPCCGNRHIKTTYHKVFCSNAKTKGRNNCKDNFWNKVDPEKRCRKTSYFFNVIAPEEERDILSEDDETWDAHQCYIERCEFCKQIDCECYFGGGV